METIFIFVFKTGESENSVSPTSKLNSSLSTVLFPFIFPEYIVILLKRDSSVKNETLEDTQERK